MTSELPASLIGVPPSPGEITVTLNVPRGYVLASVRHRDGGTDITYAPVPGLKVIEPSVDPLTETPVSIVESARRKGYLDD